ncbi:MAG: YihY/virulence factor BrkB family protein [Candidatus Limnocylindrales bacterium]
MSRRLRHWRRRALVATAPIWRRPLIIQLRQASSDFGHAGGGILAAGLAYRALFAALTLVLFAAGLLAVLIHDPERRAALFDALVNGLPGPLSPSLKASVDALAEAGLTIGLIGLVGLYWGASSVYGAIDQAIILVLPGGVRRSGLDRRVRGLVTMAALIVVVGVSLLLPTVLPVVGVDASGDLWNRVAGPLVALVLMVALAYAGYRFIPTDPPSRRDAFPPAVLAGAAMSLLTTFFALLAPFLVSQLAVYGVVASFLAALVWLNYLGTFFLIGAAWARARRDQRRKAARAQGV